MFGASYGYEQDFELNAATTEAVIYEQKEISQFREMGDTFTALKKEGYIFGGWYREQNENQPLSKDVTTGKAYAKFAPEDVLSVYQ